MKNCWIVILIIAGTMLVSCNHTNESASNPTTEKKDTLPQTQMTRSAEEKNLAATMEFPEGFRNWHHIKSMILQKGIRCLKISVEFITSTLMTRLMKDIRTIKISRMDP